jgi:hypothetical protein
MRIIRELFIALLILLSLVYGASWLVDTAKRQGFSYGVWFGQQMACKVV